MPSTKAPDPYMHVFLDAGGGNVLAFFELPTQAADGPRPEHAGMGAAHRLQGEGPRDAAGVQGAPRGARASRCSASPTTASSTRSTSSTPTATVSNWPARIPTRRRSTRKLDAVKWDMLEEWTQDQARAEARRLPARDASSTHEAGDRRHPRPGSAQLGRIGQRPGTRLPDPEPALRPLPPRRPTRTGASAWPSATRCSTCATRRPDRPAPT